MMKKLGNCIKLTDPDAGVITSVYDGWGQLVRHAQKVHLSGDSIVTKYSYHPSGLLQSLLRNGETTGYVYDNLNRLQSISIAGRHTQSFVYDQYDRITQITNTVDGNKSFVHKTDYDKFGRVSKETYPGGYFITNKYDIYSYLTCIVDMNNANIWKALSSNAKGQLTETSQGGNPWGVRRNPSNWTQPDARTSFIFHRGYTMHEHMPEFNLINMNGRVYDPLVAQFLSPDPFVQAPERWLNYNRYAYTYGNQLIYIDPNGEIIWLVPALIVIGKGILVGAAIGAGVGAVSYGIGAGISGNWSWNSFGLAVGMRAVGGAIGGGFGALGSVCALGAFGNTTGYSMLSQIASSVLTNTMFGNIITWGSVAGMATGGLLGSVLPNFNAINGGAFKGTLEWQATRAASYYMNYIY